MAMFSNRTKTHKHNSPTIPVCSDLREWLKNDWRMIADIKETNSVFTKTYCVPIYGWLRFYKEWQVLFFNMSQLGVVRCVQRWGDLETCLYKQLQSWRERRVVQCGWQSLANDPAISSQQHGVNFERHQSNKTWAWRTRLWNETLGRHETLGKTHSGKGPVVVVGGEKRKVFIRIRGWISSNELLHK